MYLVCDFFKKKKVNRAAISESTEAKKLSVASVRTVFFYWHPYMF